MMSDAEKADFVARIRVIQAAAASRGLQLWGYEVRDGKIIPWLEPMPKRVRAPRSSNGRIPAFEAGDGGSTPPRGTKRRGVQGQLL